jgi:cellulose synthase/poly-beta-1,6-N-acetylglucosamine synthase-like glycosyltransferase
MWGPKKLSKVLSGHTPAVTIFFAAHNEALVIDEKIRRTLTTDYPAQQIRILIGTDACTDATDSKIAEWAEKDSRIEHVIFKQRTGKTAILNALKKHIKTPIAIGTDANVFFEKSTITRLIAPMADPKVGMVAGNICYFEEHRGIAQQEKTYLALENKQKLAESNLWQITMGAEGGCFAIRTSLIPEIPENALVDDFYITMSVLMSGAKIPFIVDALAYEDAAYSRTVEFKRKARISAGNWQNFHWFKHVITTQFYPLGLAFLGHKVLRWFTPFFILLMILSASFLAIFKPFFAVFLGILCLIALAIAFDEIRYRQGKTGGLMRYPAHFFWMNLALLLGFIQYKKGIKSSIWQRTQRNENKTG